MLIWEMFHSTCLRAIFSGLQGWDQRNQNLPALREPWFPRAPYSRWLCMTAAYIKRILVETWLLTAFAMVARGLTYIVAVIQSGSQCAFSQSQPGPTFLFLVGLICYYYQKRFNLWSPKISTFPPPEDLAIAT